MTVEDWKRLRIACLIGAGVLTLAATAISLYIEMKE